MEQQQSTLSWRAAKKEKRLRRTKKGKTSKAVVSSSDDDELVIVHQVGFEIVPEVFSRLARTSKLKVI